MSARRYFLVDRMRVDAMEVCDLLTLLRDGAVRVETCTERYGFYLFSSLEEPMTRAWHAHGADVRAIERSWDAAHETARRLAP